MITEVLDKERQIETFVIEAVENMKVTEVIVTSTEE